MFALDLFNTDHERRLAEGAVDQLEQRRIDDLAMRMDDLVARARKANTPEAKAALMKEFQKCKAEREGYFKVRAPQDECMGYGTLVGEAGLPDVADKQAKMARLKQPGQAGTDVVTPQQRVNPNPNKGVVGHAMDWLRGKGGPGKEGPTYEDLDEADDLSKISIARYVYAQIMKALEGNLQFDTIYWPQGDMQGPKQEATLSRNQMHYLIQRLVNMSREQRKQFTQRVLADRNATLQWLTSKPIKPAPTMPQPSVEPGQMSLNLPKPVGEARGQKKNSKKADPDLNASTAQDATVQRELQKVRARHPSARTDIEALVKDEIENQERVDQALAQQQAELKQQTDQTAQLSRVNQQQDTKINSLQQQLAKAIRNIQQPIAPTATVAPKTTTQTPAAVAPTTISAVTPSELPEPITAKDQEIYDRVKELEAELKNKIDAMATWNKVAQQDPESKNELEALRKDMERTRDEIQSQVRKLKKQTKKTAKSLTKQQQATAKDMGTVRQVPTVPQLGQIPTDNGELGTQISQRAQANRRAKYGKKPSAATPTDLDILDLGQASDYLSGLRKRSKNATTIEPSQDELEIAENNNTPLDTGAGKQLSRTPDIRRLKQIRDYELMLKKEMANRIQDRDREDDEQDLQDISESKMKRLLSDLGDMTDAEFLQLYKRPKQYWRNQLTAKSTPAANINDLESDIDTARTRPTFDRTGRMIRTKPVNTQQGMRRMMGKPKATRPGAELNPVEVTMQVPNRKTDQYDLLPARIFNSEAEAREFARRVNGNITSMKPVMHEGYQDFKKVEPYYVCLAGKPVKKFDYYEQARRYHDNWKKKLYREGNKEKADKITLMPVMDEAANAAQQAAIAINMKKHHVKPKHVSEDAIPGKMVTQGFVVEYDPATRTVTISKRGQELDRFTFKGQPNLVSFQRTIAKRIKALEDDLYGADGEAGAISLSRVKVPGRGYGYQELGEESSTSSDEAESAILKRIMVAHLDLLAEFGPEKVMQAVEEVAYGVGDLDEIGSSDVSGWVHQVKDILGVPEELDEKWTAKYKRSIDCSHPKGFSQRAHCAGRKK